MLVAAGYSGFVVWHMGYSGSGPLTAATEGSFIAEQLGRTIPISETTFAWLEHRRRHRHDRRGRGRARPGGTARAMTESSSSTIDARDEDAAVDDEVVTPADRVDASRVLTLLVGLALVAYLVIHYAQGGTATLDIVNWTFLALIFLLVRNPFELIGLVKDAASTSARSCCSSRCTPASWASWPPRA